MPNLYPEEIKERARVLRRSGLSFKKIAISLGVKYPSTIKTWVVDGWSEKHRLAELARRQKQRDSGELTYCQKQRLTSQGRIKQDLASGKCLAKRFGYKEPNCSVQDVLNAYETQGFKCAICGVYENNCNRKLHIDHDHKTGEFRGLLCGVCNRGLGILESKMAAFLGYLGYKEAF